MKVKAIDTLRIHYTTIGKEYEVLDQDNEAYKIVDDRGRNNWIPKRYMEEVK
ncbi:MAG: hypothetical protein N4A76_10480 [Firmicutes bacterium]|nr:hypothetical protein [Bacillota bacterium]